MRIFALLFFTFTLPLAVLVGTILYGGFSTTILKTELAKSDVYQKTLTILREPSIGDQTYQEQQQDQVISAVTVFITAEYLQSKTEKAIDDATDWVTGKSTTPPVISFKEVKEEIEMKNPGLLTNIQELSQSIENAEKTEPKEKAVEKDMLTDFVCNDFSFPLQKNLQGAKDAHDNFKIVFPALIAFLIVFFALLLLTNNTWKTRFRWVGMTLLISGIWGYTLAVVFNVVLQTIIAAVLKNNDVLIQTVIPIIKRLLTPFSMFYLHYQTSITIACLIIGAISLLLSFILKDQVVTPVVVTKKTKSKKKQK